MRKIYFIIILITINLFFLYPQTNVTNKKNKTSTKTEIAKKTKIDNKNNIKKVKNVKEDDATNDKSISNNWNSENSNDSDGVLDQVISVIDDNSDIPSEDAIEISREIENEEIKTKESPSIIYDKNVNIQTTPVYPSNAISQDRLNNSKVLSDHFVKDIQIKKITKNETKCFILDKKNKRTLGHFSIIKEIEAKNWYNNTIFTSVYYVTDRALETIAGRASQRDIGFLTIYYDKYLATLSGTISTSILDIFIVGGGIGLIAASVTLFTIEKEYELTNVWDKLFNEDFKNGYYLPLFIGGVAAIAYGVIFAAAVIVNAVFSARYHNNYSILKKNIIDSLNNIRTPISIKDSDGDPILKIGFDFRANFNNREWKM